MKDEKPDTEPDNEVDRVLYDYLEDMLSDPSADRAARKEIQASLPLVVPDNVTPIQRKRIEPKITQPAPRKSPAEKPTLSKVAEKPVSLLSDSFFKTQEEKTIAPAPPEMKPQPKPAPAASVSESKSPAPEKHPAPAPEKIQAKLQPDRPTVQPNVAEPNIVEPNLPEPSVPEPNNKVDSSEPELAPAPQAKESPQPDWAKGRFECLIFNVSGLKLAVPLVTLGSIHQIDRKFNALPGQYDWFIGILQTPNSGNIKVLDTALCVMPERYDPTSRETLEYVITIHGYAWGLACHQVEQSITLEPDQVKWRSKRGKRPWLAGTVVEHMCSLIDTDGFQEIIQKAEQP